MASTEVSPVPNTEPNIAAESGLSSDHLQMRWNGRFSITVTLVTAIGLLVLISVGVVLGVGVWLAQKNTFALLSDNVHQGVTAAASQITQHLKPAEYQVQFLAERIAAGDIDPANRVSLGAWLSGALAAAPQIDAVMYIDRQLHALLAHQDRRSGSVRLADVSYANDATIREKIATAKPGANWGAPVWREATQKSYLNVSFPVVKDGKALGTVVAVVTVEQLSDFVFEANLDEAGQRFILSGRDRVIGHPLMVEGYPGLSVAVPLPLLEDFADPVLANIWRGEGRRKLALKLPKNTFGHRVQLGSDRYIFIYQKITGFGSEPLLAGAYFRNTEVGTEIRRMMISLVAGIVVLVLSLLAAVWLARKIARPIVNFSNAAGRIRDLDISQVQDLPGSVFRELNEQSGSFNAMLRALRWFELYVPNKIVAHLVKTGDVNSMISDARHVTVMFTDIVDFSKISQGLTAPEVADLVNHHFELLGKCIDGQDGTVDKFMGDSVMAFWGAPEKQKRRAERACLAALEIAKAIRADNKKREAAGLPPIWIRIGIHSGDVTVGNIGSPGRINYTILGDDVNVGKRIEALGRDIYPPGTDVSILISGDTAQDLGDSFKPVFAGKFELKGRDGEVEVYKLE